MRAAIAGAVALLFVLAVCPPASAKSTEVSGTLVNPYQEIIEGPVSEGKDNKITYLVVHKEWDWTGEITGHSIATIYITIHANKFWVINEFATIYDATWGDLSGTFSINTVGKGDGRYFSLHFSIESGTGDFEYLDGKGSVELDNTLPYVDYVAWLNFKQ